MSFHNFTFVKPKLYTFETFEELVRVEQAFNTFQPFETKLEDLTVNDDFTIEFDSNKYVPTKDAAINLCKLLGIPERYVYYIPGDLLMENIHRLLDENKSNKVTLIRDTDGMRLVDASRTKINKLTLPAQLLSNFPTKENYHISFAQMNDQDYCINFIDNNFPEFTIKRVDHVTNTGIAIVGTTTGFNVFGRAYSEQAVCSNGMILPRDFGFIKLVGGNSSEKRILNFFHRLESAIHDSKKLAEAFNLMTDTAIPDDRFTFFWKKVNKNIGDANEADFIFGLDELLREEYIARAKSNKEADKPQEVTQVNYYDAFYKLTEKAQMYDPITQTNLRQLAGAFLLDHYTRN